MSLTIPLGLSVLIFVPAVGQERPLVNIGGTHVNTGVPPTNTGLQHPSYLAPGVGAVVGLAHGFSTPDFSYSYMHPLSAYTHPLWSTGPYGGFAGGPSRTVVHHFHSGQNFSTGFNSAAAAGEAERQKNPTDPVRPLNLLPNPWHGGAHPAAAAAAYAGPHLYGAPDVAAGKSDTSAGSKSPQFFVHPTWHHAARHSVLWPHIGFYGHYGHDGEHQGMFVTSVALKSIGHQMGLVPGDVILSIGGVPIDSPHAYMKAVRDAKGDVAVKVWHMKTNQDTTLKLNFDRYEPPPKPKAASSTRRSVPPKPAKHN